jgi:threonyl-tRNA synthetase
VAAEHEEYAREVERRLRDERLRVDVVEASEPLGKRIRAAKLEKLPYVLVVGDDDLGAKTVGVNPRGGEVERDVPVDDFLDRINAELAPHQV